MSRSLPPHWAGFIRRQRRGTGYAEARSGKLGTLRASGGGGAEEEQQLHPSHQTRLSPKLNRSPSSVLQIPQNRSTRMLACPVAAVPLLEPEYNHTTQASRQVGRESRGGRAEEAIHYSHCGILRLVRQDTQAFVGPVRRGARCATECQHFTVRIDRTRRREKGQQVRRAGIRNPRRAAERLGRVALASRPCGPGSIRSTKFNERLWRGSRAEQ